MKEKLRRRKSTRRQSRYASLLIVAAVVLVCIFSVMRVSKLNAKSKELTATEKELSKKIELAYKEKEELAALEAYMKTPKYIEDVAKDKLGLVYPDEIVIKPAQQ